MPEDRPHDPRTTVQTGAPLGAAPRGDCLEVDVLVAMAEGGLAEDRIEQVLAHVDRCPACAEVIANLGALDGAARRVGRYQIERVLGVGGMGIVYAAFDPQLHRKVAVKLVRPENTSDSAQALMVAEARTLAQISHPNVVTVHDAGEHDGEIYLATELVEGQTLLEWQRQPHATAEIVRVWIQVARGLAAAHAVGVVHRDIKPANVLLGRDGRARIGDFGIAHRGAAVAVDVPALASGSPAPAPAPATHHTASLIAGTPAYMAPEHRAGRVDARSDQFSTCVAITEALTGKRPEADDVVTVDPPAVGAALTRGLRHDPAERFPSIDALADALAGAIAPPPPNRRRATIVAASLIAVAAGGGVAAIAALRASPEAACRVAAVPDAVWKARRGELARALPTDIAPYVEHHLARWSNAAGDVCATRDPELRARRQACLDDKLAALDRLLAKWQAAPPTDPLVVFIELDLLPHVAWCSEPAIARAREPGHVRRGIAAVTRAEAELATSIPSLERLLDRARTLGDPAVATDVAIRLASRRARSDRAAAIRTLRDAIANDPGFSAVEATIALIPLIDAKAFGEVETLVAAARARLAELGGDPALEGELDFQLGAALKTVDRPSDAVGALERARLSMRVAHGNGSPQEANVLVGLAGALFVRDGTTASPAARAAGKAADAIWQRHRIAMPSVIPAESLEELVAQLESLRSRLAAQSGADGEAMFGVEANLMDAYALAEQPARATDHADKAIALARRHRLRAPRVAYVFSQRAFLAGELGRPGEALAFAREAVAIATDLGVESELASALTSEGRALIESGTPRAAVAPLQRALALRTRRNDSGKLRGITRSWLARALWETSPSRASDHATIARDELQSYLDALPSDPAANPLTVPHDRRSVQRLLDELARWTTDHRR